MEAFENELLLNPKDSRDRPFILGESPLSWWDALVFRWLTPILTKGSSTDEGLEEEHLQLVGLPASCRADHVFETFQVHWRAELLKTNTHVPRSQTRHIANTTHTSRPSSLGLPSVAYCLARSFGGEFLRAGILKLIHDLCMFVGPLVLHEFVHFTQDRNAQWTQGLILTLTVAMSQLIMSLCLRHYFFRCYLTGLRMRSAIVMAVYQKALIISTAERNRMSSGEIGNLKSIDGQKIQDLTTYLHAIWYSFLQIGLSIYFLWQQLGPTSCLAGTAIILMTIPMARSVAAWMGRLQHDLMKARDSRVEKISEVFSNIKFIKFQGWEGSFREQILILREMELNHLFKYVVANSVNVLLWTSIPLLVSIVTFSVYIWTGHELDVSTALTSIALFEILRFPIFMFGEVLNDLVQAGISLSRVRNFLICEEHSQVNKAHEFLGVELQSATFSHGNSNLGNGILHNISLSCKCGELIAVVGQIGSGKSSLIQGILGEMRLTSGSLMARGRISYFAQTPFIMNDTIKNNILFYRDNEVDEARYQEALTICALHHDIALYPNGDETEIGERGITLSGGQKARVSLARLVYNESDIYLLDDPLSATDPLVGKFIFEQCIIKLSSRGLVIMATNAIQHLSNPAVSRIVVLKDGEIVESGTYDELSLNVGNVFSSFLNANEGVQYKHSIASPHGTDLLCSATNKREYANNEWDDKDSLTKSEEMEKGKVGLQVYLGWTGAAGGWPFIIILLLGYILVECMKNLGKWWLTLWSYNGDGDSNHRYLSTYVALNALTILAMLGRVLFIYNGGLKASRIFFVNTLDFVLKAPMLFFETTPLGRVMNRFSRDMHTIDEVLTSTLRSYLGTIFEVLGIVTVISFITPTFILGLIPIVILYIYQQIYFTRTYRVLKRIDSIRRSPQFSLLNETLDGVITVRAFRVEGTFLKRMKTLLDEQQAAYFLTCTAQCWLAVRLELAGLLIIVLACLSLVVQHKLKAGEEKFVGLAGLSISCALAVTQALNWSVRMGADLDAQMVAVERVQQYRSLPREASQVLLSDINVDPSWPSKGEIHFINCFLRYRSNMPMVLNGLSFKIPSKAKVGCCGRTGSGKSTIVAALLRLVELESGSILIDGIGIKDIGLHLLRSKVAVIPQDPVLFSGNMRSNLDPFKRFTDRKLIKALKRVGLMNNPARACDPVKTLDDTVLEGGKNYSVGQRQLIAFARAILSDAKIVLIDEATASVDASTDAMIQQVVRSEFKEATCFTIAHRINTIMDNDLILVIHEGCVEEFGTPSDLMEKKGRFSSLVGAWEEEEVDTTTSVCGQTSF